ncbi:MAG: divergent polysaccharide deacetylase family protein, partial [Rhodobacteraceae bacterium]|nr:divergent polysaccharide deacetylase family protein [Paracoccaceae bacterium]
NLSRQTGTPVIASVSQVAAPQPAATAPLADTDPAAEPAGLQAEAGQVAPQAGTVPRLSVSQDGAVQAAPHGPAPAPPGADTDPEIAAAVAAQPPVVPGNVAGFDRANAVDEPSALDIVASAESAVDRAQRGSVPQLPAPDQLSDTSVQPAPPVAASSDTPVNAGQSPDTPAFSTASSPEAAQIAPAAGDSPVLPSPLGAAPQLPAQDQSVSASTQSAPPVGASTGAAPAIGGQAPETGWQDGDVTRLPGAQAPVATHAQSGALPDIGQTPEAVSIDNTARQQTAPETEPETAPELAEVPQQVDDEVVVVIVEPVAPTPGTEQAAGTAMPAGDTTIVVRRPTQVALPLANADTAPVVSESASTASEMVPALTAYAAEFDTSETRPLLAIVVIDTGTFAVEDSIAAAASIPFAVTIALDPERADAHAAMQAWRAAGFEVAAMAKIAAGASPSDVEVVLEAGFAALPEAVIMLDIGDAGLQGDRDVTKQAMARLAADGRGFVTVNQGLNMALREALSADVPAQAIYRDLDADGQGARIIRRFIDQAAFRARQQSGVILVARMRPDTLSALTLWGTANQAEHVAMAPVSAVLARQ